MTIGKSSIETKPVAKRSKKLPFFEPYFGNVVTVQSDQMVRLFAQIWPIYSNENLPNSKRN